MVVWVLAWIIYTLIVLIGLAAMLAPFLMDDDCPSLKPNHSARDGGRAQGSTRPLSMQMDKERRAE